MNLLQLIQQRFHSALSGLVDDPAPYVAMVKPAQDAKFGDYQVNCAMSLKKILGKNPRDIAQEIVNRLPADDLFDKPEIAGPGFINLRFNTEWLARQVQHVAKGDQLGVTPVVRPRTFVIDFSSVNVAKPMHVGHLRSTIIGDSLARLLRFLGHKVITDNHLGDWGTQFGMLLYGYKHFRDEAALQADPVREMVRLYIQVRKLIDVKDDDAAEDAVNPVAEACRQETAKLHAGDPENLKLWQMFMPWCMAEIEPVYQRLGVRFDHTHGESFYNPHLAGVVQSLRDQGIAQESEGAVVIFFGENESPALIRKRDGAFTYTTTDLATIRYRMEQWRPDAILYVVDFRQALHFKNLFAIARRWGYQDVALEHVSFGSVLGNDRKPIKTREGGAIEFGELLDEAVRHAAKKYEENRAERLARGEEIPELGTDELRRIYDPVGIGAVKYADLSQNRESDYVFSWDKMLATDGNTGTYMQYAYARNRSIFRKGDEDAAPLRTQPPLPFLGTAEERALALQLLRFPEALAAAAEDYRPNIITAYLWDLAKTYSGFFQNCPVLKAETPALRLSRLLLCDLTARIIQKGLDLLGIQTVERM
jgi:arginyl-tRNA synthetase